MARNAASEKMKAIRDASLTETFLSFAWMCRGLRLKRLQTGSG